MADTESAPVSGSDELKKLEILAVEVLCGFIETVQARQKSDGDPIELADLNLAMSEMINSGRVAKIAEVALSGLGQELRHRWARMLRKDAFGRLLCKPLSPLFEAGKVPRGVHHGIRHFARLVLGEELERALVIETDKIVAACTERDGVDWKRFYRTAQPIWWQFLVRLPAAFRHFDARLSHMLGILNTQTGQMSLSANVVVRTGRSASRDIVGPAQGRLILAAWLSTFDALSEAERATMAIATGFSVNFDDLRAELEPGS
ncbi:MAG: hypothetical protein GC202_08190 [Alphaproteobacteria bacterium]|nr:hypothetical protein [Alphaproteobacteria bacterium]